MQEMLKNRDMDKIVIDENKSYGCSNISTGQYNIRNGNKFINY